jgi:uncharacterized protein with HEPN domain
MADDPQVYVQHILAEIAVLEDLRLRSNYDAFRSEPLIFRGAVYSLQCISEASRRLPEDWLAQHPDIRWKDIRGIGNHTRHEYAHVVPFLIWDIITDHLPALKSAMQEFASIAGK